MVTRGSMLCSGHTHLLVVLSIYLFICVLGFIQPAQMKPCPLPTFSPIFPSAQAPGNHLCTLCLCDCDYFRSYT